MDAIEFGEELTTFGKFQPTQFDCEGLGSEGQEDWRVLPCTITRDSDILSESNFAVAQKILDDADVDYAVHRFGHWGPGWFEILVVKPTERGLTLAGEIVCSLATYPILNEEDYSEREYEAQQENWNNWAQQEAVDKLVSSFDLSTEACDLLEDFGDIDKLWTDEVIYCEGEGTFVFDGIEKLSRAQVAGMLVAARAQKKANGTN
jgi:hypothetical protein